MAFVRRRPSARWTSLAVHALAFLPALLLLRLIDRDAVNIPFMDDWQFVPLVQEVHDGHIPWRELAAPHDEHRLLIPRIVIIASVLLSHGDYRVQCFITWTVAVSISLALLLLLRRTLGTGPRTPRVWLLANLVLFSPIQWHNWLWPMQFCYFLPFAFLVFALAAFYSDLSPARRFGLCQLCAWAGTFSFVQGLLIWPVLLPVLLRDRRWGSERARRRYALAWAATAGVACFVYFHGLFHNTADPNYAYMRQGVPPTVSTLRLLHEHPLATAGRMLVFAFTMFGNAIARGFPVSSNLELARAAGVVLLVAAVALCVFLSRRGRFAGAAFAWAALTLHAFLTAGLVGIGRVWAGPGQPLTPRYTTFGSFCLLGVVLLACLAFATERPPSRWRERGLLACGALVALIGVNWAYGHNLMGEWREVRMSARAAVHFSQELVSPSLQLAGGRPGFLRKRIAILGELGYWKPPLAKDLRLDQFHLASPIPKKDGRISSVRAHRDVYEVRGKARYGKGGRIPDAILVTSPGPDGSPWIRSLCETRAPPHWQRHARMRDEEFVGRAPRVIYGSFACRIPSQALPQGPGQPVEFWALDFAGWNVRRVGREVLLDKAAS
jgi:hypothetical protein